MHIFKICLFFILFTVIFSSCKKESTDIKPQYTEEKKEEIITYYITENLRLRTEPNLSSSTIKILPKYFSLIILETGETETIDGITAPWIKILTQAGETGWCFSGYVKQVDDKFTEEISYPFENGFPETRKWENQDWITDYDWSMVDGRYLVDPSISQADWIGYKTPVATIYKFKIPQGSILYQVRLRNERFFFQYQTKGVNTLFPLENTFIKNNEYIRFNKDFTSLRIGGSQSRSVQQVNFEYPLLGIWGKLPFLTEYRLVNPTDCFYYLEINRDILEYAVRHGTYLFKQTGDRVFESISSFSDGQMKLEIISDEWQTQMLLTPLFTLPDEEGWVAPLILFYYPSYPRSLKEED